jgi:hypothetical protein
MNPIPVPYQTVVVGSTANFTVRYETADRGNNLAYDAPTLALVHRRAKHILDICEADYGQLCQWFGVSIGAGFGPSNRTVVTLTTSDGSGGLLYGAYNVGYSHPSTVNANPYTNFGSAGDDEVIAALFVAEFAEVMMSYQGDVWNSGWSNGEGLSRVSAHLLHPAIITSFFDGAPYDTMFWLQQPPNSNGWEAAGQSTNPASLPDHTSFQQDWVSQTFKGLDGVHGDADWFSFGCAILFIYYLKSQRSFSMAQIVQSSGHTLEEHYQSLTGVSGGFTPFKALLDAFYPQGASLPKTLYDLFPLGGRFCSVVAISSIIGNGNRSFVRNGVAQQGTMCGPGEFGYTLFDVQNKIRVTADTKGFAHPIVAWTVNGQAIPIDGVTGITVAAVVLPTDPTAVSTLPMTTNIVIDATPGPVPTDPSYSTFIDILVSGNPGQVQFRVDVSVTDKFATDSANTASSYALPIIPTQLVVWEPAYWQAVKDCWNRYTTSHNRPLPWLRFYMPDPSPDLLFAAQTLQHLAAEVSEVAGKNPKLAELINARFGGYLLPAREARLELD